MAFVYILKGSRYYIGSTFDLSKRLENHRKGNTHTTRRIGDWMLVWSKEYPTIEIARKVERKMKSWKSKIMIKRVIEGETIIQFEQDQSLC